MGNAVFDFPVSPYVMPYLGVGVGVAFTEWGGLRATSPGVGVRIDASSTKTNFACQGIAGMAVPIWPVPGVAITA